MPWQNRLNLKTFIRLLKDHRIQAPLESFLTNISTFVDFLKVLTWLFACVYNSVLFQSEGKKTRVPYRDSVLTKLLENALGGNSKTVMVIFLRVT
jgi:hypothetical protein